MKNKLMLGLWRHIINVPPFLWKEKIIQAKGKFEKEHGALSLEKRLIHHFVVKELPSQGGKPVSPELISEKLNISVDRVKDALHYLEKRMTFLYRNEGGEVVWAYPVTAAKTPHKITFDTGEKLYAA